MICKQNNFVHPILMMITNAMGSTFIEKCGPPMDLQGSKSVFQGGTYFAVKYVPGVHIFRKIWPPPEHIWVGSKFCVTEPLSSKIKSAAIGNVNNTVIMLFIANFTNYNYNELLHIIITLYL